MFEFVASVPTLESQQILQQQKIKKKYNKNGQRMY